jgi:hypothetical protein
MSFSLLFVKLNENIIVEQSLKSCEDKNLVELVKITSYVIPIFRIFEPYISILLYSIILWAIIMILQEKNYFKNIYQQLSYFYFILISGELVLFLYGFLDICNTKSLLWKITENLFLSIYLFFTLKNCYKNFLNFNKIKKIIFVGLSIFFILGLKIFL